MPLTGCLRIEGLDGRWMIWRGSGGGRRRYTVVVVNCLIAREFSGIVGAGRT